MSPASITVASSMQPISRPKKIQQEGIAKAKGGENSGKMMENLNKLSQKQSPSTLSLITPQTLVITFFALKIPHLQRKPL